MSEKQPIRILVVDDQPLIRRGLVMLIDSTDDMTVIGEASDGAEALTMMKRLPVDLVLMDVRMAVMDGIEATSRLTEAEGCPPVLMLTTFDNDEYVFASLKAGASGFILKDSEPDFVLSAIRSVARGESIVSPTSMKRLLDFMAPRLPDLGAQADAESALYRLSGREREILALVAEGASNAEIAEALSLTEATVKTHVSNTLAKTGRRNRVELAITFREGSAGSSSAQG